MDKFLIWVKKRYYQNERPTPRKQAPFVRYMIDELKRLSNPNERTASKDTGRIKSLKEDNSLHPCVCDQNSYAEENNHFYHVKCGSLWARFREAPTPINV